MHTWEREKLREKEWEQKKEEDLFQERELENERKKDKKRDVREAKEIAESFKKNPQAQGIYQKKIFLEKSVDTELDFSV